MRRIYLICGFLSFSALAQTNNNYYLNANDQKFFKNDSMEGRNNLERIDMNVKEINKLHGEIAGLKSEIVILKREIEELKKKK